MSAQPLKNTEIEAVETSDLQPGMAKPGDDVTHTDGFISAWDGLELFWQSWEPSEAPRGVVCLMHGFAEHSGRYHHVATFLVRAGYAVIAIDARGHGRSAGPRGHVASFDEYPRDFDLIIGEAEKRWPDRHLVVLGHSNGGLIALHHALMSPGRVAAYAITSPFCGLKVKVWAPKAIAGKLMSRVWPTLALPTGLDPGLVSHDAAVVKQYAEDPLNLKVASSRWFTETLAAHADLLERARTITAPFLFLVSGEDGVTDAAVSEEVYHRLGSADREFELLPGLYHEALNEAGWDGLMCQIVEWFERFR